MLIKCCSRVLINAINVLQSVCLFLLLFEQNKAHYSDFVMSAMASQITCVSIVCSTVCSGADQRKHQSTASLAFVSGIHRWPLDSHHKGPVTWKMFPFDDVITNPESYDSPYPHSVSNTKEEEQYGKGFLWHFLIMKIWGRIAKYWCRSASVNERRITNSTLHDDVIKWKPFPRYWPFVRWIRRSPVNSSHKGQWRGALMFSLICSWINGWVINDKPASLILCGGFPSQRASNTDIVSVSRRHSVLHTAR